jgi:glycosyltransferase involved in cell wall biosynthesis
MQKTTKRIAYISLMNGLPWGGSEVYWSTQAIEDLEQGHHVLVSVYNWGKDTHNKIKALHAKGAQVHFRERFSHDVPLIKKIKRFIQNRVASLNSNWDVLLDFKPGEIFISQGNNMDLVIHHYDLYQKIKSNNIKYSFICHNHNQYSTIPEYSTMLNSRDVFNNAETVYFVSHRQWKLTERIICQKIKNGCFTFNPLNLKEEKYINYPENDTGQFAIVGALVNGKGHDTLFEVLGQQQWNQRSWRLNIYGKGYGLKYLKELAQYFQIEDKVKFHGHIDSATDIWKQNHILLIPSDGEGLPISLVEASISGRPAVVTDVGGNTEIIQDNQTGFVACSPTPHSFSEAMERAWFRKEEWEVMGKKSHLIVKQLFQYE